jgi:hypothetical protein
VLALLCCCHSRQFLRFPPQPLPARLLQIQAAVAHTMLVELPLPAISVLRWYAANPRSTGIESRRLRKIKLQRGVLPGVLRDTFSSPFSIIIIVISSRLPLTPSRCSCSALCHFLLSRFATHEPDQTAEGQGWGVVVCTHTAAPGGWFALHVALLAPPVRRSRIHLSLGADPTTTER